MSNEKECTFAGCGKRHLAKGLCQGHYLQAKKGNELQPLSRRRNPDETMEDFLAASSSVDPLTGCRIWGRYVMPYGHGQVRWEGKTHLVHRVAWELENGPLRSDDVLDHLCHEPRCINTEHLRVTDLTGNAQNRQGTRAASGYRGVHVSKGRYQARASIQGKRYSLGTFDTPEEAYEAVKAFWESQGIIYNSTEQRDLWEEVTT